MRTVHVPASRSYNVIIGSDILSDLSDHLPSEIFKGSTAVVTDDTVNRLYGDKVCEALEAKGCRVMKFVFSHGEASKNPDIWLSLLRFLAKHQLTRSDTVFALGGGVTGDLTGFAASVYLRGVRWIQIPTTLLAAVDASVGGKTAIDLPEGKNLIGTFYQPHAVLCDINVFDTLPESVFSDGCAEIIKYGMLCDSTLFDSLPGGLEKIEDIVARCVEIKRDIVCSDEFDRGSRQLLNFGHTIGHAIELLSDYSIPHGSAVAIGMVMITEAAMFTGNCSEKCADTLVRLVKALRLPIHCPYNAEQLFEASLRDKKRAGDNLTIVVPESVGRCSLKTVSLEKWKNLLRLACSSSN